MKQGRVSTFAGLLARPAPICPPLGDNLIVGTVSGAFSEATILGDFALEDIFHRPLRRVLTENPLFTHARALAHALEKAMLSMSSTVRSGAEM